MHRIVRGQSAAIHRRWTALSSYSFLRHLHTRVRRRDLDIMDITFPLFCVMVIILFDLNPVPNCWLRFRTGILVERRHVRHRIIYHMMIMIMKVL